MSDDFAMGELRKRIIRLIEEDPRYDDWSEEQKAQLLEGVIRKGFDQLLEDRGAKRH